MKSLKKALTNQWFVKNAKWAVMSLVHAVLARNINSVTARQANTWRLI